MMRFSNLRAMALILIGMLAMAMGPEQAWLGSPSIAVAQDEPFGSSKSLRPTFEEVTPTTPPVSKVGMPKAGEPSPLSDNARSSSPSSATMVDDAVREKLLANCSFNFDRTPFLELKENLEEKLDVNIVLTTSASDDALPEDERFSSQLSGITYASALRLILWDKNATYMIQGGVIKIISLDEAGDEKWFSRRMINVTETLALIRDIESDRIGKPAPGSPLSERRINLNDGRGGGGQFAIQKGEQTKRGKLDDNTKDIQQLADSIVRAVRNSQPDVELVPTLVTAESILINAITEAVYSENWDDYGGDGTISCVGGIMIISGPEEVIEKVESFAEDLTFNMKAAKAKLK